jgi:hypothetical protein
MNRKKYTIPQGLQLRPDLPKLQPKALKGSNTPTWPDGQEKSLASPPSETD